MPFAILDGNAQGYALPGRQVAINPVAALPHKTLFHELGHVLLGHPEDEKTPRAVKEAEAEVIALLCCEALGLSGAEYARGYLQHWLRDEEFGEESAQRVIQAAHELLSAGDQDSGDAEASPT
jgi:antirestriction protein ArdC